MLHKSIPDIDIKLYPAALPLTSQFGRSLGLAQQLGPIEVLVEIPMYLVTILYVN